MTDHEIGRELLNITVVGTREQIEAQYGYHARRLVIEDLLSITNLTETELADKVFKELYDVLEKEADELLTLRGAAAFGIVYKTLILPVINALVIERDKALAKLNEDNND